MEELFIDNLIIGAGISGLSTAQNLRDNGKDYLIIEKGNEAGGYCKTIKNKSYIWDYAGHFYHFKTKKYRDLFLSIIEPNEIIEQKKNTKIYYKKIFIDYPFQSNIHQLPKEEFCECLYDLFFKNQKDEYDNFLDMLYGKFGNGIVSKFLQPYNEKLYATDLKKLDKNAMGRFFPYADISSIIKNIKQSNNSSYNDTFLYLKKGAQYFTDKLASSLDKNKIIFNNEAMSVNTINKTVVTNSNQLIHYNNLINTSPLNNFFASIYNNNELAELVKNMSYNKVLVFNLGFNKQSKIYKGIHWVYFPDKNINFYRVGFYNNILNSDKLSLYVEIGFSKDEIVDIQYQLEKTIKNLLETEIITDDMKLIDSSTILMDPAYVHINSKTEEEISNSIKELEKADVYTVGRYGRWTYCSMEDCMIAAEETVQKIIK